MNGTFVHLDVKSAYNYHFNSLIRIEKLIEQTKALGMNAVAITDEFVMHSVVDFYLLAKAQGIHPIIGLTMTVVDEQEQKELKVTLLAKNNQGYRHLAKISSMGHLRRKSSIYITLQELLKYHGDTILLLDTETYFEKKQEKEAVSLVKKVVSLLPKDDVYLVMKQHGLSYHEQMNASVEKMAQAFGVSYVAVNDVHYFNEKEAKGQEILLRIQERKEKQTNQKYLKTEAAMRTLFALYPKAIENTVTIANKCQVSLQLKGEEGFTKKLPAFSIPADFLPPRTLQGKFDLLPEYKKPTTKYEVLAIAYLCDLAEKGFEQFYPNEHPAYERAVARLRYELGVIISKGYTNYFLIVQDFVSYARKEGIAVGPGRGSAAGSLLSYCLGITKVSPIEYNLMFERFLNPERFDDPDIDIDFSQEYRYRLFEYAQQTYGMGSTAKIITFNNFGGKLAIRDVGRVLKVKQDIIVQLAKSIGKSVKELAGQKAFVESLIKKDSKVIQLIEYASMIEGLPRNRSMHAAGLVLSDGHLSNHVPVMVSVDDETGKPILITQIHKDVLELMGLAKIDLLGLRNLDIIEEAKRLVVETKGVAIETIPLDDTKTFELYQKGETIGVFQMDSVQMRATSEQVKPTKVEDIFPLIALYRPGSMDMIPVYAKNRANNQFQIYDMNEVYDEKKKKMVKQFIPFEKNVNVLKPILENTYGVIVYQEQITQILQVWAEYRLGEADLVRRAISKKKKQVLEENKRVFLERSKVVGRDAETSERLYDLIVKFANYGFNVPHSAAYGILSYETAYLKANFPLEFMSASITSHMDDVVKASDYIKETMRMGILVEKPNVNNSVVGFDVNDASLLFGLALIKNVGKKAAEAIVTERNKGLFRSFEQFMQRMQGKGLSTQCINSLVKVGAFDDFGSRKAFLDALEHGKKKHPMLENQILFEAIPGIGGDEVIAVEEVEDFSLIEKIQLENQLMGLNFTPNPTEKFQRELQQAIQLQNAQQATATLYWIGGTIESKKTIKDKNGKTMAFLTISDGHQTWDITVFHDLWNVWKNKLIMHQLYLAQVEVKNGRFSMKNILELTGRTEVVLTFPPTMLAQSEPIKTEWLRRLAIILKQHPGLDTFVLKVGAQENRYSVALSNDFLHALAAIGVKRENMNAKKVRYD